MISKSLQIIYNYAGEAIRSLLSALLLLELGWGLLLAGLCIWIAAQGSIIRACIAAIIALVTVTFAAAVIAAYYCALSVVRRAISEVGIGKAIFENIFARLIGVSGEDPGKQPDQALVDTHMSADELKEQLNSIAATIIAESKPESNWLQPVHFLARQIQKIAVWATVKTITKSCSRDGQSANLFVLKDRLSAAIDEGVVSIIQHDFRRLAYLTISLASILSVLAALTVRQLPF